MKPFIGTWTLLLDVMLKLFLHAPSSYLYQIAHLGDDDDEPEFSSAMPLEEGDTFFFQPRPLKNLVLVDEQENLSPIMSCQVFVHRQQYVGLYCTVMDCNGSSYIDDVNAFNFIHTANSCFFVSALSAN